MPATAPEAPQPFQPPPAPRERAQAPENAYPVRYHAGTGLSTLGCTRVVQLTPTQQQRLHEFLETEFNATPL